jgi:hypothetical protein
MKRPQARCRMSDPAARGEEHKFDIHATYLPLWRAPGNRKVMCCQFDRLILE